jgi:hypothetical protein
VLKLKRVSFLEHNEEEGMPIPTPSIKLRNISKKIGAYFLNSSHQIPGLPADGQAPNKFPFTNAQTISETWR